MIRAGGRDHTADQALAVAVGYAFGERRLTWKKRSTVVGDAPDDRMTPRWAYRTYDCIPAHPGLGLEGVDVLVASGLNGRMYSKHVAAIMAMAPEVSASLQAIPEDLRFWELPAEHIHDVPQPSEPAWHLWRAWELLMGATNLKTALVHKTLHHKRPAVFPLLDNKTVQYLHTKTPWRMIHSELNHSPDDWAALETAFASYAKTRDGVPLTRLRLHDILIWTKATGDYDAATKAGDKILKS